MMKRLYLKFILIAALLGFAACTDIEGLRSDIDDLESRVGALEAQVGTLNKNIVALQALTSASTINTVTETANGYELIMSNGQVITLNTGTAGTGITPILSIDSEGYWKVDYQDGNGFVFLLCNGERVKALGLDGITPVYGVDSEGYWTIDFGAGPVYVLDALNNKVKATAESSVGNPFFSSVVYDEANQVFTVTLRDDDKTVLNIPVVSNFLFSIADAAEEQLFRAGETKVYAITKKSVSTTVVTKPQGWVVTLSDTEISVTAPLQDQTRAVIADTRSNVGVMAYCSEGNFVTIAKIKVALEGSSPSHDPQASIYENQPATTSMISFTVTLSDATSYKYLLQKASETAATVEMVAAQETSTTEATLSFSQLDARTEYTLYVLPYYQETAAKALVSKTIKTADPVYSTNFEAYNDGVEMTIGGLIISKAVFGDAKLLTEATKTITSDGVYFVPDDVTATYTSGTRKNLILIGNNPAAKGEFSAGGRIAFDPAANGNLVFANLNIRLSSTSGQIFFYPNNTTGGGMVKTFAFEGCNLYLEGLNGFSFTAGRTADAPIGIETVSFVDCDVNLGATTQFTYFFQYREYGSIGKAIFRNNIIWSGSAANTARIFNLSVGTSEAQYANAVPVESIVFENNTWINCKPSVINIIKRVDNLVLRNNLFYGAITQHTPFVTYQADCVPSTGEILNNLGYNVAGTTTPYWKAVNNSFLFPGSKEFTTTTTNPFDGGRFDTTLGVFVPNSSYASYGAVR